METRVLWQIGTILLVEVTFVYKSLKKIRLHVGRAETSNLSVLLRIDYY
jgi:hypothetical protein